MLPLQAILWTAGRLQERGDEKEVTQRCLRKSLALCYCILCDISMLEHVLVDFPSKVGVCLWGFEVEGSGRVIKACTAASFLSGWQPDSNSEGKV